MAQRTENLTTRGPAAVRQELQTEFLQGAFRARVEFNADPEQRGRVKVRLWALHGPQGTDPKKRLKTEDLPWAIPVFPLAGGRDYGSFMVPAVGSDVVVINAGSEADQFFYLGGYYVTPKEEREYLRAMGKPEHEVSMAGSGDVWKTQPGPNVPGDALEMLHSTPEVVVPAKSVKGAAIVFDDKDEREGLSVVDRSGQGLFMEAETQKGPNLKNAKQRGTKNVLRGKTAVDVAGETVAAETRVLLVDAGGQSVVLQAHKGSERVRIVSRPVEGASSSPTSHKEGVSIELDAGAKRVIISTSGSADSGTRMVVDAAAKSIDIEGEVTVRIHAASTEITGRLSLRGDLIVDGDVIVSGDVAASGRIEGAP